MKNSRINLINCNILQMGKWGKLTQLLVNWHCNHMFSSDTSCLLSSYSSALYMAVTTLYMEVFMRRWRCDLESILKITLLPQEKKVKVIGLATSNKREVGPPRKHCPCQGEFESNSKSCYKNNSFARQFVICCLDKWCKALKCFSYLNWCWFYLPFRSLGVILLIWVLHMS